MDMNDELAYIWKTEKFRLPYVERLEWLCSLMKEGKNYFVSPDFPNAAALREFTDISTIDTGLNTVWFTAIYNTDGTSYTNYRFFSSIAVMTWNGKKYKPCNDQKELNRLYMDFQKYLLEKELEILP